LGETLEDSSLNISFDNNSLLPMLLGEYDKNLVKIEKSLGLAAYSRGSTVSLKGGEVAVNAGANVLKYLYGRLEKGRTIDGGDVEAAIRFAKEKFGIAGKNGNGSPLPGHNDNMLEAQIL